MRVLIPLVLATPAAAWEAAREGPVCLLTHDEGNAAIVVSHDPREPSPYSIKLTLPEAWQAGDVFAIRFDGPGWRTISTDRHVLTEGGRALAVTDRGFGNVLDGIALNHVATAMTGETALVISLKGAAAEVEKFRECVARIAV